MTHWDWDDIGMAMLCVCIALIVGTIWFAFTRDHRVRSYYLKSDGGTRTCIIADIDWEEDSKAFCADDITIVTEALKRATEALPK